MKQCTKCSEWKQSKYFSKDKNRKDELDCWCKECKNQKGKEWYENHKEKIREQHKEYYENNKDEMKEYRENNKEKIKEWRENNKDYTKEYNKEYKKNNKENLKKQVKEYRQNNKDKIKKHNKQYKNLPMLFNSKLKIRKEIELYEEVKESPDGNMMCKCAYCGGWFEPTYTQIQNRVSAANGKTRGEQRLYCSNQCKQACPIYGQHLYPKDMKPATAREVQPQLRHMIFERDNYTCQKCSTHNNDLEVELHCHHKEGIQHEPLQSADTDMCITFCADCHKEVHKIAGCGYQDMQCK